eukprot:3493225-Rhodomonas_salina.1
MIQTYSPPSPNRQLLICPSLTLALPALTALQLLSVFQSSQVCSSKSSSLSPQPPDSALSKICTVIKSRCHTRVTGILTVSANMITTAKRALALGPVPGLSSKGHCSSSITVG